MHGAYCKSSVLFNKRFNARSHWYNESFFSSLWEDDVLLFCISNASSTAWHLPNAPIHKQSGNITFERHPACILIPHPLLSLTQLSFGQEAGYKPWIWQAAAFFHVSPAALHCTWSKRTDMSARHWTYMRLTRANVEHTPGLLQKAWGVVETEMYLGKTEQHTK